MSKVQINNCSLANVHKFRCASPSGTSFCFLLGISFCIAGTQTGGFVFQRLCWLGEASIQVTSFHLGCHLLVFLSIFWENTCCNRHRWCLSRLLCSRCFCCRLCRHPNLFPAVLLCSLLFSAVPLWFGSTIMCLHSNYFIYRFVASQDAQEEIFGSLSH